MTTLNTYQDITGATIAIPVLPTSVHSPNGIARITPKSDRDLVKQAWATWVESKKAGSTAPFTYNGLTYR